MQLSRRTAFLTIAASAISRQVPALAQATGSEAGIAPASPWLTLPPGAELTRIAFGSCLDQKKPQPIWSAIIAGRPQLFLLIGDNVYGDIKSADGAELLAAYREQAAQPELAAARARFPFLATWDDHDYGLNDASADFPHKVLATRAFYAFWQRQPERAGAGIHMSRIYGLPGRRVQVILLDTRSFRSVFRRKGPDFPYWGPYAPDPDPAKTMLGATQWAWLGEELRRPADLRLVVSSIQVLADGHGFERWGNLPAERDRLLALLRETGAKGAILISGDRHHGALYRDTKALTYPLIEVTSSSLNRPYGPSRDAPTPELASRIISAENYGQIDVDWGGRRIALSIRSLHGEELVRLDLDFANLGY